LELLSLELLTEVRVTPVLGMLVLWTAALRTPALRAVVLWLAAKWCMRRLVRWLSLSFADFDLGGFSGCGLTCAAHIPGAKHNPATITTTRRQRVPNLDISVRSPDLLKYELLNYESLKYELLRDAGNPADFLPIEMHEACQWSAPTGGYAHLRDITGLNRFQAITKFLWQQTLISI
jgi:hypothetical protein